MKTDYKLNCPFCMNRYFIEDLMILKKRKQELWFCKTCFKEIRQMHIGDIEFY